MLLFLFSCGSLYKFPELLAFRFDLFTQTELFPPCPQRGGQRGDLLRVVCPSAFLPVEQTASICQGVDLGLQSGMKHIKLGGAVDAVLSQKLKLLLVSLQPDDLFPQGKGRRPFRAPVLSQQMQIVEIKPAQTARLSPEGMRGFSDISVFSLGQKQNRSFLCWELLRRRLGADRFEPLKKLCFGVALAQTVQPDKPCAPGGRIAVCRSFGPIFMV